MIKFEKFKVNCVSMVTNNNLQMIELEYKSNKSAHLYLSALWNDKLVVDKMDVAFCGGYGKTCIMLKTPKNDMLTTWQITDCQGSLIASTKSMWKKPRELTLYVMISSHTDIGLHNSQYIQRYNSSSFIDDAIKICNDTDERCDDDKFRYTIEGTWFWNNYEADRGCDAANNVIENYIKTGKIGVCCGVAGNHTQVYGLEEICRSAYERIKLKKSSDVLSKTMSMIDNNGMSMAIIQPYAEAGYENIIFAPNQWNPLPSSVWWRDTNKEYYQWSPDAGGGGSRIDVRYSSDLPMVFYWQEPKSKKKLLVWCSTQYSQGGLAWGIDSGNPPNSNTIYNMEQKMIKQLGVFEEKYPYDLWLLACYKDDERPGRYLIDTIKLWNEKWKWPKIKALGNPDIPFNILKKKYSDIPILSGEITGGWYQHPVSTPDLLSKKFEVERILTNSEKLSVIASLCSEYSYPTEGYRRAWDCLFFNDEHSYGTSGYKGRQVYETWMQHRDWINKADVFSRNESKLAMSFISKQIQCEETGVVALNTTGICRNEIIELKSQYATADVPPFGYCVIPKSNFNRCEKKAVKTDTPPVVENKFYIAKFNSNGSISYLYDKTLKLQLINEKSEYGINEFVYTKDNHKTFYTLGRGHFEVIYQYDGTIVKIEHDDEVTGAKIEQSIFFLRFEKRISITNRFYHFRDLINQKRFDKYAYFAFPFDVPAPKRYCNINGFVAEYAKTTTGHGTDTYMAVNEWCSCENERFGVALIQLDSQLIEFDHIHPDKTDYGNCGDGSAMYSYFANDWLQTHVAGGSHLDICLRYSIVSYEGSYTTAKISQIAEKIANPLLLTDVNVHNGILPDRYSFLEFNENLRLVSLKNAEDHNGIIARLYGEDRNVSFKSDFINIKSIERVTIDERPITDFKSSNSGFLTYRILGNFIINQRMEDVDSETEISPIGSVYTGLITSPCAACGEKNGQLYLLWGQNMDENLSHYKLYRSTKKKFIPCDATFAADVEPGKYRVARYVDEGLKNHTKYYYVVCAIAKNGVRSEFSEPFEGITREEEEGFIKNDLY